MNNNIEFQYLDHVAIRVEMSKLFSIKRIFKYLGLCLLSTLTIYTYVRYVSSGKVFTNVEQVNSSEFAIVLGAAITADNQPSIYLKFRLDDAIALFKNGKIKKILLSGDNGEDEHDEISVMNNYLVQNGIPQAIIFGDYAGFDTYSTMERADKIFDIKNAIIVTQGFHLPRSLYIARQKGIDATGYTTQPTFGKRTYFFREYFATVKSFWDCLVGRKAKYYGDKENTDGGSNIKMEQLDGD